MALRSLLKLKQTLGIAGRGAMKQGGEVFSLYGRRNWAYVAIRRKDGPSFLSPPSPPPHPPSLMLARPPNQSSVSSFINLFLPIPSILGNPCSLMVAMISYLLGLPGGKGSLEYFMSIKR